MRIPAGGREYVSWTVDGLPEDYVSGLSVSFDDGETWSALEVEEGAARILVASDSATGNPGGTVVLEPGDYFPLVRLVDSPEVVIRYHSPRRENVIVVG